MEPKDLVKASVSAFNQADVEALTAFYSENAVNHQVTDSPVQGQKTVREMFTAEMVYIVENIFQARRGRQNCVPTWLLG
jgi:ketosteroid isomerase-like protein